MSTWGVGMVGYGWAAGAHIAALRRIPGVRVAAICSSRALDATDIARRHEGPIDVVASLDELLARPDVDVVDICSRSNVHASQAIEAARHGKHVIVEKPIALSLAELRAMQAAVATAGVRTCVCFELRYSPQLTATRSLIDEGLLGPLHYAELDYYHHVGPELTQYEWNRLRVGGGSSLLSIGCHSVDGMLFLMGDRVTEVVSYTTQSVHPDFARYEYPTTSVTLMRFAGGAVGKVASLLDAHQPYYYRVYLVGADISHNSKRSLRHLMAIARCHSPALPTPCRPSR
jgi:predicted dehydrogenase